MSTTSTAATEIKVTRVSFAGVDLAVFGKPAFLSWAKIEAATAQQDADLAEVYSVLLATARRTAAGTKSVRVTVRNLSGHSDDTAAYTWAALVLDMAGQLVTGRTVAADWGCTGGYGQAHRDAKIAIETLTGRGWHVEPAVTESSM